VSVGGFSCDMMFGTLSLHCWKHGQMLMVTGYLNYIYEMDNLVRIGLEFAITGEQQWDGKDRLPVGR
jgi:hypothetical protein